MTRDATTDCFQNSGGKPVGACVATGRSEAESTRCRFMIAESPLPSPQRARAGAPIAAALAATKRLACMKSVPPGLYCLEFPSFVRKFSAHA